MTWDDTGVLLIRLCLGGTLIMHGWNHLFGGGKIAGTAGWFESLGLRPGAVNAWASVVTEVGSGVLLILGLFTPLACAGAIGPMVVAGIVAHRRNGFFIFRDGYEYVLMIIVFAAALAALGPGQTSLDHALDITVDGGVALLIAVVLGVGGAATLLALAWRPAPAAVPSEA